MANVRVGIGCFVLKRIDDEVHFLVGKRKGSHGSGTWGLPGGHLEMNEDWATCASRETLEECGIQIDNVEHVATTNDIFSPALHYVTLFQSAQIKDCDKGKAVKIMEPEKCLGWIWIKWSELVAGRAVYRDACVSDDDGSKQQQQQQTMTVCFDSEPLFLPLLSVKKQYAGRVPEWLC